MRRLGELEAVIMERLWSWGRAATVREIVDDLRGSRSIAYTTVMTVMNTLHRKGILQRQLHGRAYLYEAVLSREEHTARLLQAVLAESTDPTATLVAFVEQMSAADAAGLRAALQETLGPTAEPHAR